MQYFLGLKEFCDTPLFDPSMMTHFRKRFPADKREEINKRIFVTKEERPHDDDDDTPEPPNRGKLVMDATCAPAYSVSERRASFKRGTGEHGTNSG